MPGEILSEAELAELKLYPISSETLQDGSWVIRLLATLGNLQAVNAALQEKCLGLAGQSAERGTRMAHAEAKIARLERIESAARKLDYEMAHQVREEVRTDFWEVHDAFVQPFKSALSAKAEVTEDTIIETSVREYVDLTPEDEEF